MSIWKQRRRENKTDGNKDQKRRKLIKVRMKGEESLLKKGGRETKPQTEEGESRWELEKK